VPAVPLSWLVLIIVIAGIRVMAAEADLVASAALVAVTMTELVDRIAGGAV
jgi:hypothetical protein